MLANMEVDILRQTTLYMKENFVDKLDKSSLKNLTEWFSNQLEKERAGWKTKVHDALQEVDKERKRSLQVHAQIEQLNNSLETYMDKMSIYREPSMYAAVENDSRQNELVHLQKNVNSVTKQLQSLREEREECVKVLSASKVTVKAVTVKLPDLLRNYSKHCEARLAGVTQGSRSEVLVLNRKLKGQEQSFKDMQERNMEVREKLEREIHKLKENLVERNIEPNGDFTERKDEQRDSILKEHKFLPGKLEDFSLARGKTKMIDSRDCCLQVDLNLDKREKLKSFTIQRAFSIDVYQNCMDGNPEQYPNKSDNIVTVHSDRIAEPILPKLTLEQTVKSDSVEFSNGLKCQPFPLKLRNDSGSNSEDKDNDIDELNHQVSELALKLKKTKNELDIYDRRLTAMKMGLHTKSTANYSKSPKSTRSIELVKLTPRDNIEVNGYLTGIPQEILFPREDKLKTKESLNLHLHSHFKKHKGHTKGQDRDKPFMTSSATTKCLRCYRVYTVRDNHKMACRYHPKGKRRIEKYDDRGKLVVVNFIWECCMQKPEALGCSAGEHI